MKLSGQHQNSTHSATKKPKKKKQNSARGIVIICLVIVAAALGGVAYGVSYISRIDTIFPNVRIDGIDVGGLNIDETATLLEQRGYKSIGDNALLVELPLECSFTVLASEVCAETPVSDIAQMAYNACRGGSKIEDALTYLNCRANGMDLESQAAMTVDVDAVRAYVENATHEVQKALMGSDIIYGEESICVVKGATTVSIDTDSLTKQVVQALQDHHYDTIVYDAPIETDTELDVQALYDTVFIEKTDAVYSEQHIIEPETVGISFDMEQAQKLWENAIYGEQVVIPLIFDVPEVTAKHLEEILFRDQLSTMNTSLWGSSSNRVNNVKKAAKSINEIIMMPGEEFSYNQVLGKRTAENGYLPAGAYSGGEVVQEYGGGICQVSSTLYYCCLYANLRITSRTCHYFPVSYLPAGLDATVSWGGPEYKFINNREYPIKIVAYVDESKNTVNVELWGTDTDGSYVEMTYGTSIVYDEEYTDVAIGYKAQTYRSVFDIDGKLLSKTKESGSYYHYHPEDIKWPEEIEPDVETSDPTNNIETTEPLPEETPSPQTNTDEDMTPNETLPEEPQDPASPVETDSETME